MVGETICLIESLSPLETAVLKMSTVFCGPFRLSDLAACTCSPWAESVTYFDYLRLFRAINSLARRGVIEELESDLMDMSGRRTSLVSLDTGQISGSDSVNSLHLEPMFMMRSFLMRRVGG